MENNKEIIGYTKSGVAIMARVANSDSDRPIKALASFVAPVVPEVSKSCKAGIYAVVCLKSRRMMIGNSSGAMNRLRYHKMCIMDESDISLKYRQMKQDLKKHGLLNLQFVVLHDCSNMSKEEILSKQESLIKQYVSNGYTMYNQVIAPAIVDPNKIDCPTEYRDIIVSTIEWLTPSTVEQLRTFISTTNELPDFNS